MASAVGTTIPRSSPDALTIADAQRHVREVYAGGLALWFPPFSTGGWVGAVVLAVAAVLLRGAHGDAGRT